MHAKIMTCLILVNFVNTIVVLKVVVIIIAVIGLLAIPKSGPKLLCPNVQSYPQNI